MEISNTLDTLLTGVFSKESLTDESEEWSNVEPHLSLGHGNTELIQYLHNTVYRERGVKSSYGQGGAEYTKSGTLNTVTVWYWGINICWK